ncbi:MAG: sensor histidine kinase, partial [Acidimicrobiia bacterium]
AGQVVTLTGTNFAATLAAFCDRVRERSGLEIVLEVRAPERLGLSREREMWRICQEAITNAERHAAAGRICVRWVCDGRRALLEVSDDGRGFDVQEVARSDAYGLVGMRERADAIGAALTVTSAPGGGTTVRCLLEAR